MTLCSGNSSNEPSTVAITVRRLEMAGNRVRMSDKRIVKEVFLEKPDRR